MTLRSQYCRQVVDHEKETEGPQLHDGLPGPSCFPSEFDDSLAKKVESESERNLLDHARGSASTVHSTMRASMANTAAVGLSMVEGVEAGSISSRGTAPLMSSHTDAADAAEAGAATAPAALNIVEAYSVEETEEMPGSRYEAELAEPQVLSFYQRKLFASIITAVTLLAVAVGRLGCTCQQVLGNMQPTSITWLAWNAVASFLSRLRLRLFAATLSAFPPTSNLMLDTYSMLKTFSMLSLNGFDGTPVCLSSNEPQG